MHELQVKMLNAKIKYEQMVNDLENGVKISDELEDYITSEYADASIELEAWVTPLWVALAEKQGKKITTTDIEDLFESDLDGTIEYVLNMKF